MTPIPPADPAGLAQFKTEQLMLDLLRRALTIPVYPAVMIRAAAIYCCATYVLEGEDGVRPVFAQLRPKLANAMDSVADPVTAEEINVGITAALCAGDREFAHAYFLRRYKRWLTVEIETSISGCKPLYE